MKVHFNRVTLMREVQRVTYFLGIKTARFSIHFFFSQLIRMHGFWQIPAQRAATSNGNTNHDRARLHISDRRQKCEYRIFLGAPSEKPPCIIPQQPRNFAKKMEVSYPSVFFDKQGIWWRKQADNHPVSYTDGIDGHDFHFINGSMCFEKENERLSAPSLAKHLLYVTKKGKDLKAKQNQQHRKKQFTDLPLEIQDIIFELATSLLFISSTGRFPAINLWSLGYYPYWENELAFLEESELSDPCRIICNKISKACPLTYVNRRANLSVLRRLYILFEARNQQCREDGGGAFNWMLEQLDVTARFNADLAIESSLRTVLREFELSTRCGIVLFPLTWAFDHAVTTVKDVADKGFRMPFTLCSKVNRIHVEWDLENNESLGMPTGLLVKILEKLDKVEDITISLRPCVSPRDHERDKRVIQVSLAQRIRGIRLKDGTYIKVV